MTGYTKLFSSIVASTIWREDDKTRILWITMLALSDSDGFVEGSIPGLADLARVTIEECEQSLAKLQQPDKYSRTPDHDGRRIEVIDGGWFIVNRAKYRDKDWQADKVERHREANRRWYERQSNSENSDNSNPKVSESDRLGDKKEKEKEKEKEKIKSKSVGAKAPASRATQLPKDFQPNEQHHRLAKELGVDLQNCFAVFCDHHASKGNTFKDWNRAFNTWLRNEVKFNRGRNGAGDGNRAEQRQASNLAALEAAFPLDR